MCFSHFDQPLCQSRSECEKHNGRVTMSMGHRTVVVLFGKSLSVHCISDKESAFIADLVQDVEEGH